MKQSVLSSTAGGNSAIRQGCKKAKTRNILPVTDKKDYPTASTEIIPGSHHDAFNLGNLAERFEQLSAGAVTA